MKRVLLLATGLVALAACGQSDRGGNDLEAAAEQSDPASAAILQNAAENGTDPQVALEQAGNAAALGANAASDGITAQARPNLPQSPNRKDGTQPPDKVATPAP